MKINIVPTKKLALLSAAFWAVMLTFSHNANAVIFPLGFFPDPQVVGTVTPADPDTEEDEVRYINHMIRLAPGDSDIFRGNTIARSTNTFGGLPDLAPFGPLTGEGNIIDVGGPPNVYAYLFAKYEGDLSQLWFIGNVIDVEGFEIPLVGPNGGALLHWTLWSTLTGQQVPDGGATVMLLGTALGALGMARRFLTS